MRRCFSGARLFVSGFKMWLLPKRLDRFQMTNRIQTLLPTVKSSNQFGVRSTLSSFITPGYHCTSVYILVRTAVMLLRSDSAKIFLKERQPQPPQGTMIPSRLFVALVALQEVQAAVKVPTRGWMANINTFQRVLQLTDEEEAQVEQCGEAVEAFHNENPELNRTLEVISELLGEAFAGCLEDTLTNPGEAYTGGISCEVDGRSFEDGAPYEAVLAACADAAGELVLASTIINCSYSEEGLTVKMDLAMTNIPSCIQSQEVEPSCDLDLYERLLEEGFESDDEFNCTASASMSTSGDGVTPPAAPTAEEGGGGETPAPAPTADGGGDDEPSPTPAVPTAEEGGGGDTPAPAPTAEGGSDNEPAPTPDEPRGEGGGAAATTSACAGVFGSLGFGSTLMATTVLTILVI
jgi:hypothetical protein